MREGITRWSIKMCNGSQLFAHVELTMRFSSLLLVPSFLTLTLAVSFASIAVSQEKDRSDDDINALYFQKKLELAKHDLETALEANREIPNMNSKLSILRLQNHVSYVEQLLKHATAETDHDLHQSHLHAVENVRRLAEKQLAWAREMDEAGGGFIRKDQLERLELAAELARLAVQRAKQPEVTQSPLRHLQWEVNHMQSQLLHLQIEFERLRSGH